MKKLQASLYFMVLTWLTCNYAYALDKTITVSGTLVSSTNLLIQNALNQIGAAGGGTLTLAGTGSVLVDDVDTGMNRRPLTVYSNTTITGGTDQTPYGMVLVGENNTNLGLSYRITAVLQILNSSTVTIKKLDIEGGTTSPTPRPLCASAISIMNSDHVQVITNKIAGVRKGGIAAQPVPHTSTIVSYLTIQDLDLIMNRKSVGSNEPEGGVGIYCSTCQHAQVTNCLIHADDYFHSGPPNNVGDPRVNMTPPPTAMPITDPRGSAPAIALVQFSGGSNNEIDHNTLLYSNAAAIFVFAGETNDVIWANHVSYCRQAGLDIDQCTNCTIVTNTIGTYIETSPISLARSTTTTGPGLGVQYNTLQNGGMWMIQYGSDYGALNITGSASGCMINCTDIENNEIYGSNNQDAVYFFDGPFGQPIGNVVTNNSLWSGLSGWVSGSSTSNWSTRNTVSNNRQY
jgi:hypothetical protein